MICGIRGTLEALGNDWAVINVNGISFRVFAPTSTLSMMGSIGSDTRLHTHLHMKEDGIALYGFASADELSLFQTITSVSGVGPRLALAMLSVMNVEQLSTAIAGGNAELLTHVPGIGKKVAARLTLELKDKISPGLTAFPPPSVAQENADVLAVLTALGYSAAEASHAIADLSPSAGLTLEDKVKLALQYFGAK